MSGLAIALAALSGIFFVSGVAVLSGDRKE